MMRIRAGNLEMKNHSFRASITRRQFITRTSCGLVAAGFSKHATAVSAGAEPLSGETDAIETGPADFTVGLIADAQYADVAAAGQRHYRASIRKLTDCVADFNRLTPRFVIHLGDLIDRDLRSFGPMRTILDRLEMPVRHVAGNHDFSIETEDKSVAYEQLGLERGYYQFTVNGWRFVILDGNDISFHANTRDSKNAEDESLAIDAAVFAEARAMLKSVKDRNLPQAYAWNGGIGSVQMTWLRETLAAAGRNGERVIVCNHYPVVPHPFALNLWNDLELIQTLESSDTVVAYFNGHHHTGNFGSRSGIHYITIEGMVETPDQNAYALLEVRPGSLTIRGRGRVPDRVLTVRPTSSPG